MSDYALLLMMIVGIVLAVFLGGGVLLRIRRRQVLQWRFSDREAPLFGDWYEAHLGGTSVDPDLAYDVVNTLGRRVGVEPTRLRPSDRLDTDFRDRATDWIAGGYGADDVVDDLARVSFKHVGETYDPVRIPETLGELIADVDLYVKACRILSRTEDRKAAEQQVADLYRRGLPQG